MIRDILIVDSVKESVGKLGILIFSDQLLQEAAGQYFFVDVDEKCDKVKAYHANTPDDTKYDDPELWESDYIEYIEKNRAFCGDCTVCMKTIPLKVAWLIMQFIKLERHVLSLTLPPNNDIIENDMCFTDLRESRDQSEMDGQWAGPVPEPEETGE